MGAILGAGISTFLKDALQSWVPALTGLDANIEGLIFGVLLIVILKVSPRGLWQLVEDKLRRATPAQRWSDVPALPVRAKPKRGSELLSVASLQKNFGGLAAVQDISFVIRAGEILGLIGPNGAGSPPRSI